jgi:LPS O-antigen subunit length determinant protein (WzzB/FepE family)
MKTWHVILGIAIVFLAGALAGAGGALLVVKHKIEQTITGGPDQVRVMLVARLTRELNLDPAQQADMARAVKDAQEKMLKLRATVQPEAETIIADSIAQMNPCLSQEQRDKLRQLHDRVARRWKPALRSAEL